ncbi:nucleoid-structuring protein H-NS, partial [Rhodococcus opacus]
MNVISGAARAARNAVAVLRDAGEGAWSFTSSKLRRRTQTSEEARAGSEVEPQITIKPESEPTPSEVPPAKKAAAGKTAVRKAAAANPARSETTRAKRGAKAIAKRL